MFPLGAPFSNTLRVLEFTFFNIFRQLVEFHNIPYPPATPMINSQVQVTNNQVVVQQSPSSNPMSQIMNQQSGFQRMMMDQQMTFQRQLFECFNQN